MGGIEPLVQVEVLVNVEGLRRGWVGQVELTPRIEMLADRGYLRILGHVNTAPVAPPAVLEPPAPIELPPAAPKRSRAKRDATTTLPEADDGDSSRHA